MDNKRYYTEWDGVTNHVMWVATCPICQAVVHESFPHGVDSNGTIVCRRCAFKVGLISEKEYLSTCGVAVAGRAAVHNGEIYLSTKQGKFHWEKPEKEIRHSGEYAQWRSRVFERDNYTCQRCGKRGGRINAHHIKPFAGNSALRLAINNGITLCENCHREIHRSKDVEWLHS